MAAGHVTALAVAVAVALRYARYRRTLRDLGAELRAGSDAVLDGFTPPPQSRQWPAGGALAPGSYTRSPLV